MEDAAVEKLAHVIEEFVYIRNREAFHYLRSCIDHHIVVIAVTAT